MEALIARRQPKGTILRVGSRQCDIKRSIGIEIVSAAVGNIIPVDRVINKIVVVPVGGYRPEAAFLDRRKRAEMQRITICAIEGFLVRVVVARG